MKKTLIILAILLCCLGGYYAQSESKDLTLDVLEECNLQYAGNACLEKYEITNTTTKELDGNAVLHIDYQGVCGEFPFDGEGIEVKYNNLSPDTSWINGSVFFENFAIPIGTSFSSLAMSTHPALCPGNYVYTFTLSGTADVEYVSSGGGTFHFTPPKKERIAIEGDLIRNPTAEGMEQFDIYIIKLVDNKKFKRLILNPHVFESYGHLYWENVKLVDHTEMNGYETSSLVRVQDYGNNVFENEVYFLIPNGDIGVRRHLNISQSEFEGRGYDSDSIYDINLTDKNAYILGEDIL